jgi:DNA-binding ferritin-like protein
MVTNISLQINPSERVIHILQEERLEVMELRRYLMNVRTAWKGRVAPRIQDLLDGLFLGITHCSDMLTVRVNSLSYDSLIGPAPFLRRDPQWKTPAAEPTHCGDLLRSIQSAYAHCVRTTAEAMCAIDALDDPETSAILRWVSSSTKEALWFIEIYLEGLAVGMNTGNFPQWKRTSVHS